MTTKCLLAAAALVGVLVGISQVVGFAQRGSSSASLVGVWKVSEVTYTGPNAKKVTNPQPGIRIFTQRYYAVDEVSADKPRPEAPEQSATDKQIVDAWTGFVGQGGTYEIKGNEVTTRRIAAKSPTLMKAGTFSTSTFALEGNTLTLVTKATQDGPVANPTTYKLTRLE